MSAAPFFFDDELPRVVLDLPDALDHFEDHEHTLAGYPVGVAPATTGPHTQRYHFPPPHSLPPASDLSREELLDLAADNSVSCGSELLCAGPHVSALCRLVLELAQEQLDARSAQHAAEHELQAHRIAMVALLESLRP